MLVFFFCLTVYYPSLLQLNNFSHLNGVALYSWGKLDGHNGRIAAHVWHSVSIVCCCFQHWSVQYSHTRRPGSGRPRSTDARQDRRIVQAAVAPRTASREEMQAHFAPAVSPRIIGNRLLAAGFRSHVPLARIPLKRPLDGQYFCTIFEVAQWYWTFVGTIESLCNVIDSIKTFWNILRNLKILCRLWVVLRNIPSILLFRFSFLCLLIDYENKMWRKGIFLLNVYNCINPYALFGMFQPELSRGNMNIIAQ